MLRIQIFRNPARIVGLFFLLLPLLPVSSCAKARSAGQPVYFSHKQHGDKKLKCAFCHSGAEKYSRASIPGVTFCMSCHSVVKPDSPEVIKSKAYLDRKEEIPWRRIYHFEPDAAVFFNHRRHAAAGIDCAKCHGDVAAREVLELEVKHSMSTCLRCHKADSAKFRNPKLSEDCSTCHR